MSAPLVVKVGGSTLGEADTTFRDLAALARAGETLVVVHGGGPEASRWLEAMDIPSRFERGLRITDERVLPVVVAVFAGLVNKRIVAALQAEGLTAAGIAGVDGHTLECGIIAPELGAVGRPVTVHTELIETLTAAGIVPVVSSIGYVPSDGEDLLVNVNADDAASAIAAALGARLLVYLTDVEGVRDASGNAIASLTTDDAQALIDDGTVSGGMIPKVEACLRAAAQGVASQIVDGREPGALLALEERGTRFRPAGG